MIEMRVQCYAGYRADERPLRFVFRGHEYEVQDLDGQWYSPDARKTATTTSCATILDRIYGPSTASGPPAASLIHPRE